LTARSSPRAAAAAANSNARSAAKARAPEPADPGEIAARAAGLGITADRVLIEYARIAFADLRLITAWGPEGLTLKPSEELGEAEAAAICEIVPGARPRTWRVKVYDKKAALDALARHLGLFPAAPKRREANAPADPAEDAREVLARRLARLAAGSREE
jgi:phage terminase small subunit